MDELKGPSAISSVANHFSWPPPQAHTSVAKDVSSSLRFRIRELASFRLTSQLGHHQIQQPNRPNAQTGLCKTGLGYHPLAQAEGASVQAYPRDQGHVGQGDAYTCKCMSAPRDYKYPPTTSDEGVEAAEDFNSVGLRSCRNMPETFKVLFVLEVSDGEGGGVRGGCLLPPVWVSKEAEGEGDGLIRTPFNHPQICRFAICSIWGVWEGFEGLFRLD
ncbi:hypothetical protein SLEP1_g56768 [Rubroshorea leprosula]|uniref:Uncharacterized protein n=1 Tax=Rubroshorea leprosula TaxID=152421 RepID=A0AAV5MKS0_9ROSI|nr:hypothetical protein SLEP1_g56768 [Rubroshorea leprosula]